jgi:hypothetical protein
MPLILIEEGHNMFLLFLLAHVNLVHKNPSNKYPPPSECMYETVEIRLGGNVDGCEA